MNIIIMFTKARLTLTSWYLVIIMTISLTFSAFIYNSVSIEFQRRLDMIERRLELPKRGFVLPSGQERFFIQDLIETKRRVLLLLIYTNGVVFILTAAAGYFLAGRTLGPIEEVMGHQKRFIADASHELKTPLTALQTSIEVGLRNKKLNLLGAKKMLKDSLKDVESLKLLTNDLLSLAKYQDNGDSKKEKVKVDEVVNVVYRKLLPLANKKKIKVSFKSETIFIWINKESLEKLITVLIDNAVKYTPKGGRIALSSNKVGNSLVIEVKDNGIGIPEKDIPFVFDRFYRVDSSRSKEKAGGFGLGLSIAKKIVDVNKGLVTLSSTPGKGSTFIVKLPLQF